jgi:hypothetical protein
MKQIEWSLNASKSSVSLVPSNSSANANLRHDPMFGLFSLMNKMPDKGHRRIVRTQKEICSCRDLAWRIDFVSSHRCRSFAWSEGIWLPTKNGIANCHPQVFPHFHWIPGMHLALEDPFLRLIKTYRSFGTGGTFLSKNSLIYTSLVTSCCSFLPEGCTWRALGNYPQAFPAGTFSSSSKQGRSEAVFLSGARPGIWWKMETSWLRCSGSCWLVCPELKAKYLSS